MSIVARKARSAWQRARLATKRAWWDHVLTREDESTLRLNDGLRMVVPHKDLVARKIFLGIHEPATTDFLVRYLRRGDTFLDIGAHVGYFTLLAASRVGPEGRVHAFEPSPKSWSYLNKNVGLNRLGNVMTHCMAVSDRVERRELCVAADGHSAWNSLAPELPAIPHVKQEVPCTTLDAYVRDSFDGARITLIKVDVEGWECSVVRGGQEVLAGPDAPTLIIEFSTVIAERAGHTVQELRGLLVGLGYTLYRYEAPDDRARAERVLVPDAGTAARYETNLVATKDNMRSLSRHAIPTRHQEGDDARRRCGRWYASVRVSSDGRLSSRLSGCGERQDPDAGIRPRGGTGMMCFPDSRTGRTVRRSDSRTSTSAS